MIRVEPAPDVSVRMHGGAGKQQGSSDDLFAALLAMLGGVAAPMQAMPVTTTTPDATASDADAGGKAADALPVTGATLAAALGAVDAKALGKPTSAADGNAIDITAGPTDGTATPDPAGKTTALPPGLAPTGTARADTSAGDRSQALDHTAAGDHAAAKASDTDAAPKADPAAPVQVPAAAAHRPEQAPDTAATPGVSAASAAQAPADVQRSSGPAPAAYVSELPSAVTEAAAQLRPHGGGMRLSVRLDPPAVGTVLISLHVLNDQVRLVMHAPDGGGADALQQQRHLVEAALSAEGLSLDEFRVDVGGGWNGTPADSSPQGQGERHRSARGAEHAMSFAGTDTPVRVQQQASGVWL